MPKCDFNKFAFQLASFHVFEAKKRLRQIGLTGVPMTKLTLKKTKIDTLTSQIVLQQIIKELMHIIYILFSCIYLYFRSHKLILELGVYASI